MTTINNTLKIEAAAAAEIAEIEAAAATAAAKIAYIQTRLQYFDTIIESPSPIHTLTRKTRAAAQRAAAEEELYDLVQQTAAANPHDEDPRYS